MERETAMAKSQTSWPRFIQVNALDNVAIVATVGGLRAGTSLGSECPLLEDIPEGHKVALADIEAGAPVIRYGATIGYASHSMARGSWVHDGNFCLPEAPQLSHLPLATAVPAPMQPLEGYTFEGLSMRMVRSEHETSWV